MTRTSPAAARTMLENLRSGKKPTEGIPDVFKKQDVAPAPAVGVMDAIRGNSGQSAAPPPAAIEHLKSNPTPQMRQFFDQKFGPGSSGKILGSGVTL